MVTAGVLRAHGYIGGGDGGGDGDAASSHGPWRRAKKARTHFRSGTRGPSGSGSIGLTEADGTKKDPAKCGCTTRADMAKDIGRSRADTSLNSAFYDRVPDAWQSSGLAFFPMRRPGTAAVPTRPRDSRGPDPRNLTPAENPRKIWDGGVRPLSYTMKRPVSQ